MSKRHFITGEIIPREDYIEPDVRKNGRHIYGFADLEIGDQMRCPLRDGETHKKAKVRVLSAAICWKVKNLAEERKHIRWRAQARNKYILIERAA